MENQLVSEFMARTGASPTDALSCLKSWGWDLKKALIDYTDTSTTEYFNGRAGLTVSMEPVSYHKQNSIQSRKPSLTKTNSIDIADCKKFYRGISRATENVPLVSKARTELTMDFHSNCTNATKLENLQCVDTPDFTFTLPDLTIYPDDFRKFLEKDLIECSTLSALETTQRLNWWLDLGVGRRLWPLATTGDGNCLLHAASLAMWGFHDRKLTLRSALYSILAKGEYRDAMWRRWRFQQTRLNKQAGFVYSEIEWAKEWEEIVSLASPEPRHSAKSTVSSRRRSIATSDYHHRNSDSIDDTATYESLEEIHIFALSHFLRRAIIVIADTVLRDMNGEAMAPIPFGGVYLPFEIPSNECYRAPLLLTYDMAHFSALVAMEQSTYDSSVTATTPSAIIPLIDIENVLLPIQFCIDPGELFDWRNYDGNEGNWALTDREHIALLKEYLDIVYVNPLCSPDDEIFEDLTDEEYEKRISEAELITENSLENIVQNCNDNNNNSNGLVDSGATGSGVTANNTGGNGKQSKAAKQLQSVAKQFGSIGKNMSKKIKKNIGSITKIGSSNSNVTGNNSNTSSSTTGNLFGNKNNKKNTLSSGESTQSFSKQRLLCARLKAKRHDYQDEMIKNYLECAQNRFLAIDKTKEMTTTALTLYHPKLINSIANKSASSHQQQYQPNDEYLMNNDLISTCCINAGCTNYGTSLTSYMCEECFEKQKECELNSYAIPTPPRYGTGNSKFYTQSDLKSHNQIKRLPSVRRLNELDQTLYLSNSTFYNDKIQLNDNDYKQPQQQQHPHYQHHHHHHHHHHHQNNNNNNNINNNNNNNSTNTHNNTISTDINDSASFRHGYSPTDVNHQTSTGSVGGAVLPLTKPTVAAVGGNRRIQSATTYTSQSSDRDTIDSLTNNSNDENMLNFNNRSNSANYQKNCNLPSINSIKLQQSPPKLTPNIINHKIHVETSPPSSPPIEAYYTKENSQLFKNVGKYTTEPLYTKPNKKDVSSSRNAQPCRSRDCMYYGNAETNYFCSKCCQNSHKTQSKILTDV